MTGKLEGKVALVTGGTTGIGLAIAQEFVNQGAYVFITGRREAELAKAKETIGRNVTAVQGDVAKLEDLDKLYDVVGREKGKLDIVVANAGIGKLASTAETTPADFDAVFNVNVRGVFFTVQKALKLLQDGGSVVVVASNAQYLGIPGFAPYSATKAAVRTFVRSWAAEFKDRGIRFNTLSPGPIDTPIFNTVIPDPEAAEAAKKGFTAQVPLGRIGRPEEMGKAALFLASDDSSFSTGIDLVADGGMSQI
ncbi:NAD(P)-dependent dehydrogenase (short-subunit alcohol dehydrogenase family) [Rhizomicrobium palustre]|uniref:NAD(P)-dependent dehydrogenase (Short-subunit alcohol dehydrogenase family) n=1 Tax=Rhizomicrobium palustre TaxID=189966 RepID=A0A846MV01_9PROT|nr:glucose 1-dehydrogenase [Rhizomicrobium palustre]NIK87055.1 NAD(P)-dependent dehydrogenase (short-subunit alcohol dehydrogenase family) [Rhizomicrobium palustre]